MKYLTLQQLREKLGGRGCTTIYRDLEHGRLPKPIRLGGRIYWLEQEIDALMQTDASVTCKNTDQ